MKTKKHLITVRDLKDKGNGGFTIQSIVSALKVPRYIVHDIISRYKGTSNIEEAKGRGRKSIFTNNENKLIIINEFKKTSSAQTVSH